MNKQLLSILCLHYFHADLNGVSYPNNSIVTTIVVLRAFPLQFQLLGLLWMVWAISTTALWPSQRLVLVVQLCYALLHYYCAVSLVKVGGSFPMEVKSRTIQAYHTSELEQQLLLEHYFSIATLKAPQQGSSAVTYLLLVIFIFLVIHRASMWGYTLAPLVSPVHWVSGGYLQGVSSTSDKDSTLQVFTGEGGTRRRGKGGGGGRGSRGEGKEGGRYIMYWMHKGRGKILCAYG